MNRIKAFSLGLALAISVGVLAQDSVIPSRLRVQSIGVGIQAPSTNGDIRATRIGLNTAPAGAAGTLTATAASISGTATVGTLTATSGTIGGQNVCLANGTNCPAGTPVVVVVNRTGTSQGLFSGSTDPIQWNNDVHDPNNLHDPGSQPDRIFLPQGTGYAQCQASATLFRGTTTTNTNYHWGIYINLNGNTSNGSWGNDKVFWYSGGSTSGDFVQANVISAVIPTSNASDYIQVRTSDNWTNTPTGPSIMIDGANSATSTRASCWAVGR